MKQDANEYFYSAINTPRILKKTYLFDFFLALGLGWTAIVAFQIGNLSFMKEVYPSFISINLV